MTPPLLQGFLPIVDDDARVLILGSFPSALSLVAHQYYANPRNAFWPITSELFGFEPNASDERRLATTAIPGRRALGCAAPLPPRRQCRLRDRSEELGGQQLCRVVANYPTIARVYFNGATAAELYRRLADERDWPRHYQRLPSTSPAHVMRPGAKLAAWQAISASIASAAPPGEAGRRQ
jgi:hypoxanthine-DNA glycosylase